MKILDDPKTEIWKKIKRLHQLRNANRKHYRKHNYTGKYKVKIKNNFCICGCNKKTAKTFKRGHNLKLFPKPENLKDFVKGKKGLKHPRYKGRYYDNDGYGNIFMPVKKNAKKSGHILEHRLMMETFLGRELNKNEVVHHKNGNKKDNTYRNLQLMTRSEHGYHHYRQRVKNKKGKFVKASIPCDWRREKGR